MPTTQSKFRYLPVVFLAVLFLFGFSMQKAFAQTNLLINGDFSNTAGWTTNNPDGFAPCAGLYTSTPCMGVNGLIFSYPAGDSVSQTVSISNMANLVLTMNHFHNWFGDGYTVTVSTNNGNSAYISCPNSCSDNSIKLMLSKANLVGATSATVTIVDDTGNGWGGNYGALFTDAWLFYLPSTADTQQSLVNTASALQNIYTLQNTVLANSFSYDELLSI